MKNKRIVLASLLKPVDDPRMYHKFAKSLSSVNKYEINIIGFPSKQPLNDSKIQVYPLNSFKRKSAGRWKARINAARLIWKLKPDLLIIGTHELLGVALLQKLLRRTCIVYDVRENYPANLRHRGSFTAKAAALIVRFVETISSPFLNWYTLAETSYAHELPFLHNRYTVLENKALIPDKPPDIGIEFTKPPTRFLFTGTLSQQTGTDNAIRMIELYRSQVPDARLHIVGNSFDDSYLSKLNKRINNETWISGNISEVPLPYETILKAIQEAEVGIIAYEELGFLTNKQPTKLFEYLGNHLPILINEGSPWTAQADELDGCVTFNQPIQLVVNSFLSSVFYPAKTNRNIYWTEEHLNLLELSNKLL